MEQSKFSESLKNVISDSRLECLEMGFGAITPEMFILSMLRGENGALRSMKATGVDLEKLTELLRKETHRKLEKPVAALIGNVPLTKLAEKALKLSHQQTIRHGKRKSIDTIHLLFSTLEGFDRQQRDDIELSTGLSLKTLSKHFYHDDQSRAASQSLNIEEELEISKAKILELKEKSLNPYARLTASAVTPLSLFFNMEEYSKEEIKEIVGLLSELYHQHSGDHLVIKGASQFETVQQLACV
ncbi:hypothetical protein [Pedobacter sp. UC225_65]|uniref:hypothetical protein n=1 Tax=Pedobacter sp. UC225_65 TaxID=3350173 RepID=UPI0036730538